jgi:hypothetical protein
VAAELRQELGHGRVFRPAPDPESGDIAPPPDEAGIMAGEPLTAAELGRRFDRGARLVQDGAGAMGTVGRRCRSS